MVVLPSKKIKKNSLLLIRLDRIGDYVLFRNFIEILKKSEKYKNYEITLVGNQAWKDLSLELDHKYIMNYIWIDRDKFSINLVYRFKKIQEIASQCYEVIINFTFSREFFFGDNIVKIVNGIEKIGSVGDLSNTKLWQKKISDKYYDNLIKEDKKILFEFYRSKKFTEKLLDTKLEINKPYIDLKKKKIDFQLPQSYAILFIGASSEFKKWNVKSFAKVGEYLKERYNYEIVLCGAPDDSMDSAHFRSNFKGSFFDFVGRTSLVELLNIFNNANIVITNETFAAHLSVSLSLKNVFVIYNGNHYGRFTPYPKEISQKYHVIYHPEIEKNLNNYKKISNTTGFESNLNINDISKDMVLEKIDTVLNG